MPSEYPTGTRLRCERCGSEFIVLKTHAPALDCCGEPMNPTFVPAERAADRGHQTR
jgi:Desulfoferrodoxin, N-terminal domain